MNINEAIKLALGHLKTDNLQQSENIFNLVLEVQRDNFTALHFLGVICYKRRQYESATTYLKRSLELAPRYVDAYCNLGVVLHDQGYLDEAITYYQKALQINPNFVLAYYNLGNSLNKKGQLDEAISVYQRALQIDPNLAEAYIGLGFSLQEKGQFDEAISIYQKALQINPDLAEVYCNLSNILQEKGQVDEAIVCCKKALQLNPISALAYHILGDALNKQGHLDESLIAYAKSIDYNPHSVITHLAKCISRIPIIYRNEPDILISRRCYQKELIQLRDTISLKTQQDIEAAAQAIGRRQPFFLAYQGMNDKELQQLYGNLVWQIMSLRYPQFAVRPAMPSHLLDEPLRVGFVSGFFCMHSNWKIPIKGWIENLNKHRFSLYCYYTGRKKDKATGDARISSVHFVEDIYSFEKLCKIIREDNLHVLIYPEIGMDPMTVRLQRSD